MSLRLRLALWWGGLTGLVILVVGLFSYASESLALYNDLDRELRSAAQRAAASRFSSVPTPQDETRLLAATDWVGIAVWLYGPEDTLLAASPNAVLAPAVGPDRIMADPSGPAYDRIVELAPPYVTIDPGDGKFGIHLGPAGVRWRVYVLPAVPPATYAVAAAPLRDIDAAIATTRRLVPLLAVAAGVTMLLAGLLLASRALRPVAALTGTAGAIAHARAFDRRVAVRNPRDELGTMATTFNDMLDSLQQAYVAQQRFVADASHEIRTPLTSVLANLVLIERHPAMSPQDHKEAVSEAIRETRRLVRLVSQLLALARADAGVVPVRRRVELDRVLLDAFNDIRHLADAHQLSIDQVEPVAIDADPDQLKQLLLILLDNALKYTPVGGSVRVALTRRGANAEVVVLDTGTGISKEDLPHVFDRFYRGAHARAHDPAGSGLGLSIARWIAGLHGGEVVLASEDGHGTVATMRLPIPVTFPVPTASGRDAARARQPSHGGLR